MCLSKKSKGLALMATLLLAALAPAQKSPFIEKLPSVTEDEALEEPDYAVVAADTRKIADEIERRLIEANMDEAADKLSARDAPTGHAKAEQAYLDMKEMIKFCDSSGAGNACKFKLQLSMGMNAGNTLGQLSAGMKPGSSGLGGMGGKGSSGQSGGQNFGMFGPDQFGKSNDEKSRMLGDRKKESNAAEEGPGDIANDVDEIAAAKKADVTFTATGSDRGLEEYRNQIDGYFKRLAEEEATP